MTSTRVERDQLLVLAAGLGFALLCGLLIGRGAWWVPVAACLAVAVIVSGMKGKTLPLVLVAAAALIQLPLSAIGPIPQVQLSEIIVPLLLLGIGLRALTRGGARSVRIALASPRALHWAIGIYAAVIAMNFIRSRYMLETTAPVNRPMYAYFVALGIYLLTYLALAKEEVRFETLFRVMFWLSLVLSVLGIAAVAFKLPLHLGNQAFSVTSYRETTAVRVGFLDTFGVVGLALVTARPGRFRLVTGIIFAAALFASGGRAAAIGAVIGIAAYLIIGRRWSAVMATVAVAAVAIPLALPALSHQSQFERLTNIGTQARRTNERAFYYTQSIKDFEKKPILGTGMGAAAPVFARDPAVAEFYQEQLWYGGHATYNSLLKNFGLVGFLPFVAAILIAIARLGALVHRKNPLAGAFFIILVTEAVAAYASGNGSDPFLFFALGAAAAVIAVSRPASLGSRRAARSSDHARPAERLLV